MEKPILLISIPVTEGDLKAIKRLANDYEIVDARKFNQDIERVEIMYGWNKTIGPKILESNDCQLKWIQVESAGVDHLDTERMNELGIILTNAGGVHGNQISESILGMLFAYTRNIKKAILNQEHSKWEKDVEATDLEGKNVMIVGTGYIGSRLAEILTVFHAHTIGVNRTGHTVPFFEKVIPLDQLKEKLPEMDIIVDLLPETNETYHLFSEDLFKKMKNNVIFINMGRGGTVKTDDLITYCQNKKIAFAALDVFETEPLPVESPLWQLDNVLITSHISGVSDKYFERLIPIFLTNLEAYVSEKKVVKNQID